MMKKLILTLMMLPFLALANNISLSKELSPVVVSSAGEVIQSAQNKGIIYQGWNSNQLKGRVFLIQHIAGRSASKKMNAAMMSAITAAKLPVDKYLTVTIINANDVIWGTSGFVKSSVEDSKIEYPHASFVLDQKGIVAKAWDLQPESSAIILLDKQGKVLFSKDGVLSQEEIDSVIQLIKSHL
jgi:YtfJ family uncharacterized protein